MGNCSPARASTPWSLFTSVPITWEALVAPSRPPPGVAGGYRLGAGAALPPLLLDDEEAVAVAVGLRTAAGGSIAGIEETSVRALVKLEQVLPSRLRHRVNAVHAATVAVPGTGPTVDAEVLTTIAAAIRASERLRFDYANHDGNSIVRTTEPHGWSRGAAGGISLPGTTTARTGARSGWTA